MKVIINLFGTAIRFWVCEMPRAEFVYWDELRAAHEEQWTNLFFDLDWLSQLGLSHWSDLAVQPEELGMVCTPRSSIEIRKGRKILEKFSPHQFVDRDSLFDLYRTKLTQYQIESDTESIRFILMQAETGYVGKLSIDAESIRMDELEFELTQLPDPTTPILLTGIRLNNEALVLSQEDTVVIKSQVYFAE